MHVRHLALQIEHSETIGDSSKYPVYPKNKKKNNYFLKIKFILNDLKNPKIKKEEFFIIFY
jgi:hypothetical protein